MTREEKISIIKSLFWDYKVDPEEALKMLTGEADRVGGIRRNELFIKILNWTPWHKVRQLIPEHMLPHLLSEEVIRGLFPPELRDKYRYVRSLL